MTKCIFPLNKGLKLLDNLYFDNPRSFEEIKEIASIIKKANHMYSPLPENKMYDEEGKEFISLELLLNELLENYKADYDVNLKNQKKYKNIYYQLACNWVILRYQTDKIENKENIDYRDITILLVDLLSFISFDETDNFSMLLSEYFNNFGTGNYINNTSKNIIVEFMVKATAGKRKRKDEPINPRYTKFTILYNELKKHERLLLDEIDDDLIRYISEIINNYTNSNDYKMKIVSIVSIFELLVAHNPDNNRFNVEDSIKKQFVNKILLILYITNPSIDTDLITKELSHIYDLRSCIAHGNFNGLPKICKKIYDFYKTNGEDLPTFEMDYILSLVNSSLMQYLKIILVRFLNDRKLFEVIKN